MRWIIYLMGGIGVNLIGSSIFDLSFGNQQLFHFFLVIVCQPVVVSYFWSVAFYCNLSKFFQPEVYNWLPVVGDVEDLFILVVLTLSFRCGGALSL